MVDFAVDSSKLAGFKLDCQDVSATLTSSANRPPPRVPLPTAIGGLMAEPAIAFQNRQSTLSGAHQRDVSDPTR